MNESSITSNSEVLMKVDGVTEDEVHDFDEGDIDEFLDDSGNQDDSSFDVSDDGNDDVCSKKRRVSNNSKTEEPDNECINSFLDKCNGDVRIFIFIFFISFFLFFFNKF